MSDSNRLPRETLAPRQAAVQIVGLLQGAGYVAYLAGGCVRDELLGYHPKDYDVATDARPETVRRLFKHSRYVGESFGVVQVRLPGCRHTVEVATFRSEWGYQDGRRPSQIDYTDARHDAQRRDFTINALFENPLSTDPKQRIIDFVGGQSDLEARVVRAVGDPEMRLCEDYLRLLRAVRFASRLNFEVEPRTADAIRRHAKDLGRISRQRIGQEVMWMLTPRVPPGSSAGTGVDARSARAIAMIHDLHLDGATLNEDHTQPPLTTVRGLVEPHGATQTQQAGGHAGRSEAGGLAYATVLAAWLLDRHLLGGEPAAAWQTGQGAVDQTARAWVAAIDQFVRNELDGIVRRWRVALCLSNEHRDALRRVLQLLPIALSWVAMPVARRKRLLADPLWSQVEALAVALSDRPAVAPVIESIRRHKDELIAGGVCPDPWVTGTDLIAMGHKPGPAFRRLLDAVYDAQLEGIVASRDQALEWLQKQR